MSSPSTTGTSTVIRTISPSTGEVILERPEASLQDAKSAASAAKAAQKEWRSTPISKRKEIVAKAMQMIQDRKEELGKELTMQMGRPIAYGVKEIETMQKRADYLLGIVDESLKDLPGQEEAGYKRWVSKEPVGVALVVFAWNFPYLILVNALVPALLTGNSVILKPSPQTPLIGERFHEIFAEAGLPKNVLQVLHSGSPDILKQIVQLPDISLITFTGSTKVGLSLREATARRCVPLNLELGGNDPAYVRPDADLKYVAENVVDGAVFNSGQSCCAIERVYVHADVYDEFVKELQNELANYKLGDPFEQSTNVGPVISAAAKTSIEAQVQDAISKGAVDGTPENKTFSTLPSKGSFVAPRILLNVTHDMDVMREETFGPIIPVQKVSSDAEAVSKMNDSHYGLSASVWTKDVHKGEELMEEIEAGTVFLNRADYPSPDLAWTGWKTSGLGCTLGPKGFDAFYKLKSHHVREKQA